MRSLRNTMTRQYLEMEKNNVSFEELEHLTLGALRKAVVDGDVAMGTVMAGQIAGMIKKRTDLCRNYSGNCAGSKRNDKKMQYLCGRFVRK